MAGRSRALPRAVPCCGGILTGIYCLGRLRSGSWTASFFATSIGLLLATVSLLPRPLLFGWLFLVIEVGILWSLQRGRDWTIALPALFLLWINVHGSWFIGFVLMAIFVACGWVEGEWGNLCAVRWAPGQKRKLLIVVAASFAALFINPYGWRLVTYPLDVAFRQKQTVENIAEWGSLDFHSPRGKLLVIVLVAMAVLQLVRRRRWVLQDVAFAVIAMYGAVTYVRFLLLPAILLTPLLAIDFRSAAEGEERPLRDHRLMSGLAIVALLGMMCGRILGRGNCRRGWRRFSGKGCAVGAEFRGQGKFVGELQLGWVSGVAGASRWRR